MFCINDRDIDGRVKCNYKPTYFLNKQFYDIRIHGYVCSGLWARCEYCKIPVRADPLSIVEHASICEDMLIDCPICYEKVVRWQMSSHASDVHNMCPLFDEESDWTFIDEKKSKCNACYSIIFNKYKEKHMRMHRISFCVPSGNDLKWGRQVILCGVKQRKLKAFYESMIHSVLPGEILLMIGEIYYGS
jgi:hypothetical protein